MLDVQRADHETQVACKVGADHVGRRRPPTWSHLILARRACACSIRTQRWLHCKPARAACQSQQRGPSPVPGRALWAPGGSSSTRSGNSSSSEGAAPGSWPGLPSSRSKSLSIKQQVPCPLPVLPNACKRPAHRNAPRSGAADWGPHRRHRPPPPPLPRRCPVAHRLHRPPPTPSDCPGRATYRPSSYSELVTDAVAAIASGISDGLTRMEVEFPAVSNVDGAFFCCLLCQPC